MQNITEFKEKIKNLECTIAEYYKTFETPDRKIIKDGLVNIDIYYNSKIKILWILKEPYDYFIDGKPFGGGWSLVEDLDKRRATGENRTSWQTFDKIIYTTYCILNNFINYDQIRPELDIKQLSIVLRNIAYINIQKLPATKTSNNDLIRQALQEHQDILLKQINIINPDIIIDCSMQGVSKFSEKLNPNIRYAQSYHPSYSGRNKRDFVNKIIEQLKK